MAEEFEECSTALSRATALIEKGADDVRVKFCNGALHFIVGSFLLLGIIYLQSLFNMTLSLVLSAVSIDLIYRLFYIAFIIFLQHLCSKNEKTTQLR